MTPQSFVLALMNVPAGFALTLTGLVLFLGMVIAAAIIRSGALDSAAESRKAAVELGALKIGINAELTAYVRATVLAMSNSNLVTEARGAAQPQTYFGDPIIFRTSAARIGLLGNLALVGAIVVFYENLIQLNVEFQRMILDDEPLVTDYEAVSYRLRLMCYNLALALEVFNGNEMKIPSDLKSTDIWDRKGALIWNASPRPATLTELLRAL